MYAVVEIQGSQFKVEKDQKLFVNRIDAKEGSKISFDNVLLIDDGNKVQVGKPNLSGTSVEAKVVAHKKDDKVILRLVYPSLKFKKIKFPRYYFTKISEIAKKVIYLQLTNTQNRNQNFSIRKNNNIYYYKLFKRLKINGVKLLKIEDFNFQNYMDFPILVTNKEKLNNYLLLNNIETKYLFYHNCAKIFGNKK